MNQKLRIGSVSFLNSRPLIEGLDRDANVELHLEVPSRLLDGLRNARYDVALLPVIDYQRMPDLTIIPAGAIGSDGPTLTVRIFSKSPIGQTKTLACDPDSHTSVALARIILSKRHHVHPELVSLSSKVNVEACLLIGDKVVCDQPIGFPHQLDLGQEWKALTGLPFVFATWMARPNVDLRSLCHVLTESRCLGTSRIDQIIEQHALPRGWPPDLARQYLLSNLKFEISDRELDAIRLFHRFAHEQNLIDSPRDLVVYRP